MPPRKRSRKAIETSNRDSSTIHVNDERTNKRPRRPPKGTTKSEELLEEAESDYDLDNFPARATSSPWKFGPHVSAAGGVENAVLNAASIGATAFALFLKSQRKWESKELSVASIESFKRRLQKLEYDRKHVLPHGSYLVNLGNSDPEKREKSYQCFLDDLKRCEQLGLLLYNFHPGSTVGSATKDQSVSHVAECINRAHDETNEVVVVIENMAGAGNVLGSKFSEIGAIIRQVKDKSRVGVCLDTCHMFAAGYDIRTRDGWNTMMTEFEQDIGMQYLRGMHLNDSKGALNSGKDRHQNLGVGHLTLRTFAHVLSDERTKDIPLILETPAHESHKPSKANSTRKRKKSQGEDNSADDEEIPTKSKAKGKGKDAGAWEIWTKEVQVLGRVAALNLDGSDAALDEKAHLLDEWTQEIKEVVLRLGGETALALAKDAPGKGKKPAKRAARGKAKKGKKQEQDEASELSDLSSCA